MDHPWHNVPLHITGVVQDARELLAFEQLQARDFYVATTVAGAAIQAPGPVAKLSATPWRLRGPAPRLGEHTGAGWLGAAVARPPPAVAGRPPLEGVRVLTFTQAWAGPFATTMLALLGADVVQIESRRRPDVWRGAGRPVAAGVLNPAGGQEPLNCNGMYNAANFNKVRVPPSWLRKGATTSSLLSRLYSHRNAWTSSHLVGQRAPCSLAAGHHPGHGLGARPRHLLGASPALRRGGGQLCTARFGLGV
jgi:hypothetical protein